MPAIGLNQLIAGRLWTWGILVAAACGPGDIDDDLEDPAAVAVHAGLEDVQVSATPATASGSQMRRFLLSAWYLNKQNNTVAGPVLNCGLTVPNGGVDPAGEVS